MAQMIPRLKLTPKETAAATEIFFEYLKDKSKIVVTFAMQEMGSSSNQAFAMYGGLTTAAYSALQGTG